MRRRAFTFWQAAGLLALIGVLAAIFFPMFGRTKGSKRNSCISNLKQIGLAMMMYSQDHDQKLMPASTTSGGWVDILQPYAKSRQLFHCQLVNGDKTDATNDYFYNSRLVGIPLKRGIEKGFLVNPESTIMNGDGTPNGPTDANLDRLPDAWRKVPDSPTMRHEGRANYVFADGHVKVLAFDAIDDGPRRIDSIGASFAIY